MITANDLKGIMTMMPAFTKQDGDRIDATDTIDTDELTRTVDKIISDGGCNVLTTTGSFAARASFSATRIFSDASADPPGESTRSTRAWKTSVPKRASNESVPSGATSTYRPAPEGVHRRLRRQI